MTDPAHAAQQKILAQQAADIALVGAEQRIRQLAAEALAGGDMKTPVLRWIAGLAAAVIAFVFTASLSWVASSVTEMQQTLARIDERQKAQATQQDGRFVDYDRRISRLEGYHTKGGSGS